jgi:hypothetical protein
MLPTTVIGTPLLKPIFRSFLVFHSLTSTAKARAKVAVKFGHRSSSGSPERPEELGRSAWLRFPNYAALTAAALAATWGLSDKSRTSLASDPFNELGARE